MVHHKSLQDAQRCKAIAALMQASGHTLDDCTLMFNELVKHGYAVSPLEQSTRSTKSDVWRHKKRNTVYEVLGEGQVQCGDDQLRDEDRVLIYREVSNGTLWARRPDEFHDGRFERISPSAMTTPDTPSVD